MILKGAFEKMILNSEKEKSLGSLDSLLADKGIINAVRCSVCRI